MKQYLNVFILLFSLMALPGFVLGQRTITGKVTDSETGEGLLGATVQVLGTGGGAITGVDGSYTVQFPDGATQLRFSYTGYTEQILTVGASNILDVRLVPGSLLSEIVVIGYGTVKKEDATGSVATVTSEDFNKGALVSPQELVVGKIAGVQVTPSADPGGGAVIRIRGGSSLSASNDPLIVIDGVPVGNEGTAGSRNALNIVNPNDIETFTVLKDASATAIYGSRASNGVILITTKKGSLKKKFGVNFAANLSFSDRSNQIKVMNADDYRALINERFADGHPARTLLGSENTDWQSEIYRLGIGQDYSLGIAGGVGFLPYRVAFGYTDRNGILKTDKYQRTTGSINLTPSFFGNRLQVSLNAKGMLTDNRFGNRGAIGSAIFFDPTKPVKDANSPYGGYWTWTAANGEPNLLAPHNPVALLELRNDVSQEKRIITNAQFDYRFHFLPDLRANLNIGYDGSKSEGTVDEDPRASFGFSNGGLHTEYNQTKTNKLLEFYMNYVKPIGSSKIDLMGGYSWQHFYLEDYSYSTNTDGSEILSPARTFPREYYLVSLFGRLNLDITNRFLLTFTVRRDGSSRFGPDNRWGLFPSAAFAWKIVDRPGANFNTLKLRLGYGETGQQDIGGDFYPYLARYITSYDNAQYQFGDQFYYTLRPNGYDANLKWEQTATYNVALDYGFFDNRVNGSLEVYKRITTDLINFVPVPAGTNLTNYITTNVGDLENQGVEASLNIVAFERDRSSLEFGANLTVNRNKITRLTATDDPNYQGVFTGGIGGGVGNTIQIHSVGYPANSFFVYEQVYDDQGVPIEGLYVDRNGDGQVTPDDRYRFEKPWPDALVGFYLNYTFGNYDLSFGGRASFDNYVYNNVQSNLSNYNNLYYSTNYINNTLSSVRATDFSVPQYFSDYYIQNASFLRFDHITLGYNFPKTGKLSSLRLYGSIQNPILITRYQGLDPEVFGGIDNNVYPRSTTYLLGLNANF